MSKDQELEILIQAAVNRLLASSDKSIQRIEARTMASLIMQRSPEQILKMEKEMRIEVV